MSDTGIRCFRDRDGFRVVFSFNEQKVFLYNSVLAFKPKYWVPFRYIVFQVEQYQEPLRRFRRTRTYRWCVLARFQCSLNPVTAPAAGKDQKTWQTFAQSLKYGREEREELERAIYRSSSKEKVLAMAQELSRATGIKITLIQDKDQNPSLSQELKSLIKGAILAGLLILFIMLFCRI